MQPQRVELGVKARVGKKNKGRSREDPILELAQ